MKTLNLAHVFFPILASVTMIGDLPPTDEENQFESHETENAIAPPPPPVHDEPPFYRRWLSRITGAVGINREEHRPEEQDMMTAERQDRSNRDAVGANQEMEGGIATPPREHIFYRWRTMRCLACIGPVINREVLHFIEKVLTITAFSIEFAWAVLTYVSATTNHVLDYQFPWPIKVIAAIPVVNYFLFCATFYTDSSKLGMRKRWIIGCFDSHGRLYGSMLDYLEIIVGGLHFITFAVEVGTHWSNLGFIVIAATVFRLSVCVGFARVAVVVEPLVGGIISRMTGVRQWQIDYILLVNGIEQPLEFVHRSWCTVYLTTVDDSEEAAPLIAHVHGQ